MHNSYEANADTIEAHRQKSGKFGEHNRQSPDALKPTRTITVIARLQVEAQEPVPYPESIPAGEVSAALDDVSGRVFVSIDFPDGVHVSHGVGEYGDNWDNLSDEPTGYDEATEQDILGYLRAVRENVDRTAERIRYAALSDEQLASLMESATGNEPEADDTPVGYHRRAVDRGHKLTTAFSNDPDVETRTADALADILIFAKENGIDLDEAIDRAKRYAEDDEGELKEFTRG